MFVNFNDPVDPDLGFKIGQTYGTMGWASLFMPAVMGILADKYIRAEILLGICHLLAGAGFIARRWSGNLSSRNPGTDQCG